MDDIKKRVDKKKELDTDIEKKTAKVLLDGIGTEAVSFEDVPGVQEDARVKDDGSVYVRIDNLTFTVRAGEGLGGKNRCAAQEGWHRPGPTTLEPPELTATRALLLPIADRIRAPRHRRAVGDTP